VFDFSFISKIHRFFNTKSRDHDENRVVLVTPPSSITPLYSISPSTSGKTMDVPSIPMLPLGPAYIAASLEEAGFEVKVVDLTFSIEGRYDVGRVAKAILNLEPGVVGISSFTSTITSAYTIANAVKKKAKDLPIVIGGPHASALPHRTLEECPAVDAAIIGEGEYAFRDFTRHLFDKGRQRAPVDLKGVVFRRGSQLLGDPKPVYIEELDRLPFPARHLFNLKKYAESSYYFDAKQVPVTSIVTSRGCPYGCLYCSRTSSGHRFRVRSPENVVRELEWLKNAGFNEVQIVDDDFTEDRERVLELCRLIKAKGLDMSFNLLGGIRVDKVDEELLSTMYDAGCYVIHFGVESGDDQVLKYNRKGVTSTQIKNAIHLAKRRGYKVIVYVIVGLPGSSIESEKRTINLLKECGPDATRVSVCTPYPGSALWGMLKDRLEDVAWERYNESDVSNPIYISGDQTKAQLQLWMDMVGVDLK
jgi:anaerobic magnesium-protoporphyrin IX monomethyl ester cyclase